MLKICNMNDVLEIEKFSLQSYLNDNLTTYAILQRSAKMFQDRTALIFLPRGDPLADLSKQPIKSVYSYKELWMGVRETIYFLLQLGVSKGDVVSYLLPNTVENYFLLYAAQAVGIANPISPFLPPEQIVTLLQSAESKVLIIPEEDVYPELRNHISTLSSYCPKLEKIIVLKKTTIKEQSHQQLTLDTSQILPENICSYFHTSGTTGVPKLAAHTHLGNAYMAWIMGILAEYALPNTVVLSGLPMFHAGAPMISGLAAFHVGATVVVMSPIGWFDPQIKANFWKIVEKYKGSSTTAMPFVYHFLSQTSVEDADISSLRHAISGMAVNEQDFNLFKNKTGIKIANLWGQTEITSIGAFNPAVDSDDPHFGSMGIRLPFEQLKVVRFNAQGEYAKDCDVGEPGILCVNGPHVPKNWHNTGDWVRQEADGYFTFLGRNEDFIQRSDALISLLEIERAACQHPQVAEAAAVSMQDSLQNREAPVLYFTLQSNAHLTPEQLNDWLKVQSGLSADALPIQINLLQSFPKNGMGKTIKYLLKKQLESV